MVALTPAVAQIADRRIVRPWPAICGAVMATIVVVTVVLVSVGLAPSSQSDAELPLATGQGGIALAIVLVVATWLLVEEHPGSAVGLSLVAIGWLAPGLAAWPLLPAQARAALLAAGPIVAAGIALTVVRWRPSPTDRRTAPLATIGLASAAVVAHLLGYDPFFDTACRRTCEASPAALATILGPRNALGLAAALTLAASSAASVASLRSRAASPAFRAAGVVAAMLFAVAALDPWWRWGRPSTSSVEELMQSLGTGVIVSAVLVALVRTSQVRRNVREVVEQLAGSAAPGSVATIQFAVPHDGRWVNAAGERVSASHPERCAVLSDAEGDAVRLVLGRWADARQVLSTITPAGRLALENARLQAAGLARLADVQASQRRIVEATDLERRRIERDLHDGAQQRLVAVTMQLSSARRRFGTDQPALAEGGARVQEALDALRDLSHDSLTEVLYAEGMSAAVEELVARLPLRVDVDIELNDHQLPPAVQMAAYLAIAAALDNVVARANTDRAHVTLEEQADGLIVRVADGGQDAAVAGRALTDVAERVGALGGSLEVTSRPGDGTTVVARLPCES